MARKLPRSRLGAEQVGNRHDPRGPDLPDIEVIVRITSALSSWRLYSCSRLIWTSKSDLRIDYDVFRLLDVAGQALLVGLLDRQDLFQDLPVAAKWFSAASRASRSRTQPSLPESSVSRPDKARIADLQPARGVTPLVLLLKFFGPERIEAA